MDHTEEPILSEPGRLRRMSGFYKKAVKQKKNVHFAAGRDLETVKVFDKTKAISHYEPDESLSINKIPPLFKCKSGDEIIQLVEAGHTKVSELFQGYNALHWYCNANSTSPSLIATLVNLGIDMNAVDQCPHISSPIMRHTALGFACRNANVKAIYTLLQLGASPFGLERESLPKYDSNKGKMLLYPSPLQALLCQPIHGPRPACPWVYHLTKDDEDTNSYLNEEDTSDVPEFRSLSKLSHLPIEEQPVCQECTKGFHIWEPWPSSEAEEIKWRQHRRRCWYNQIKRLGARLQRCAQLLLDYSASEPRWSLSAGDDPNLWPSLDFLLETSWRFLSPAAACWRDGGGGGGGEREVDTCWARLTGVPTEIAFPPFGEICDLLLEHAGYAADGPAAQVRGQQRLLALIAQHPEFESFQEGEYFDIDSELKSLQDETSKKQGI